jgi:LmbE family N-acetylglucosaminyl deacetylase
MPIAIPEFLKRLAMKRREFIKGTLAAAGLAAVGGAAGRANAAPAARSAASSADRLIEQGARVMWVAPHPDDESMVGPILAKAGPKQRNPLYFLVLTHGDGGECAAPEGCRPDLGTTRGREMRKVAELYGATLQHEHYWNAPLPGSSFPKRHLIAQKWVDEHGDPTVLIAKAVRDFKPDLLLTFCPLVGFTGHPEHQAGSRFATAAVRLAADRTAKLPGEPFRVANVYFGINHYWLYRMFGGGDPLPYTETFNVRQPCLGGKSCAQIAAEYTLPHRSQKNDMEAVRRISPHLDVAYLRRTDPFTEIFDPFEPTDRTGMA